MPDAMQKSQITEKTEKRNRLITIALGLQLRCSDAELQDNRHNQDTRGEYARCRGLV
jgi:hypothetical protein